MALALLCRGNIEEKYRCKLIEYINIFYQFILDIFSLATYENDGRNVLDRQRLSILFQQAIVVCVFLRISNRNSRRIRTKKCFLNKILISVRICYSTYVSSLEPIGWGATGPCFFEPKLDKN